MASVHVSGAQATEAIKPHDLKTALARLFSYGWVAPTPGYFRIQITRSSFSIFNPK